MNLSLGYIYFDHLKIRFTFIFYSLVYILVFFNKQKYLYPYASSGCLQFWTGAEAALQNENINIFPDQSTRSNRDSYPTNQRSGT